MGMSVLPDAFIGGGGSEGALSVYVKVIGDHSGVKLSVG
jgi:hypothetical protein